MSSAKLLPYELTGNNKSKQIIVFLHGWPDTTHLWDGIIPHFKNEYYILNVSYPNYSPKEITSWGIDNDEIIHRLNNTIDTVNADKRKITFVTHDWGAVFGYAYDQKYPKKIDDMISMDVGASFKITFPVVAYQSALIVGFLIGGRIGNWITHSIRNWARYEPPYKDRIDSSWNYPYYYTWKKIIKSWGKSPLESYTPSCSVAYLYGDQKSFMFHDGKWIDNVKKSHSDSEVIPLKARHWIMHDDKESVINIIKKRLIMVAQRK